MEATSNNLAYLVIREGASWTDVFRLIPGRTVTIGRASTNQIVIKDERASRCHAEIFLTGGQWTIRDLESRNGTLVAGEPIRGDRVLSPGEVVRIGHTQLAFVHDLSRAFVGFDDNTEAETEHAPLTGAALPSLTDSHVFDTVEPTTITHRRLQTRFLKPQGDDDVLSGSRLGRAAAKLCRLVFSLASQTGTPAVANVALDGLLEETNADAGAVLLDPLHQTSAAPASLEIVAARSNIKSSYHRVSEFLAAMVLRDGEAVLGRNIEGDSALGIRDSRGEIPATSVICAPIRFGERVAGLVHLYSISREKTLDADDLEFTLAVAENVALALKNLDKHRELSENLSQTRFEVEQLRKQLGVESELVGTSQLMLQVQQDIGRAAPSRATVLIRGESGVGKELVARAVHFSSPRKKGPFVCLNCAALSETLLESELFGHERGAFTGATDRKLGKFEQAHQGTLMLDEIGEMTPSLQSKFLRVLEGHPFERVGGSQQIKVDVRVIAATNRDLEKAVTEGTFRRDLYFRLRVVEIHVPPLRKRPADVAELAHHFLERFTEETGRKFRGFTPEALQVMQRYRWPGNVRELKNVVERAVLLAQGEYLDVDDLLLSNLAVGSESGEMVMKRNVFEPVPLEEVERQHIAATLEATDWNKSRTSEILGIERSTLDRKIRRYQLTRKES